jgi:hypothetical protein
MLPFAQSAHILKVTDEAGRQGCCVFDMNIVIWEVVQGVVVAVLLPRDYAGCCAGGRQEGVGEAGCGAHPGRR